MKSAAAIHAYFGQKITLLSLIFTRWKNFIVRQNIFSSGSMCRCILLDKIVHDKHNNKLHWTRVEQTIMHNYAQLCTCINFPPPASTRPQNQPPIQRRENFTPKRKRSVGQGFRGGGIFSNEVSVARGRRVWETEKGRRSPGKGNGTCSLSTGLAVRFSGAVAETASKVELALKAVGTVGTWEAGTGVPEWYGVEGAMLSSAEPSHGCVA